MGHLSASRRNGLERAQARQTTLAGLRRLEAALAAAAAVATAARRVLAKERRKLLLCAWILWQVDETPIIERPGWIRTFWNPVGGATTEASCDTWARSQLAVNDPTAGVKSSFRCLPDTIDPRPRR